MEQIEGSDQPSGRGLRTNNVPPWVKYCDTVQSRVEHGNVPISHLYYAPKVLELTGALAGSTKRVLMSPVGPVDMNSQALCVQHPERTIFTRQKMHDAAKGLVLRSVKLPEAKVFRQFGDGGNISAVSYHLDAVHFGPLNSTIAAGGQREGKRSTC
jgi:hypothetical protein